MVKFKPGWLLRNITLSAALRQRGSSLRDILSTVTLVYMSRLGSVRIKISIFLIGQIYSNVSAVASSGSHKR